MGYELGRIAATELVETYARIARDDPRAAATVVERIRRSMELLGEQPMLAPQTAEAGVRRHSVPDTPYSIVYEVDGPDIIVLHVWHGRRRPPPSWRP